MTQRFPSKEEALQTGIRYCRGTADLKISKLERVKGYTISQMDFADLRHKPAEAEIYALLNSNGQRVMIGATKDFTEDCWYLWLIDPESGMAQRA
jgi:hypothetical protein